MVARLLIPYRLPKLASAAPSRLGWRRPARGSCCSTVTMGVARRQPNSSNSAGFINGQEIIVDGGFEHMLMSLVPRPGFERGN
jgi:hypothetical protein